MKKPIYYAIRHHWGRPSVVVVTTERRSHWWGRDLDSHVGTHGRTDDIDGRFDTVEAALAVREEVARVRGHFSKQQNVLSNAQQRLRRAEAAMVGQVVQGLPVRAGQLTEIDVTIFEETAT